MPRPIPKKWRDTSGRLRHFVASVESAGGVEVIVSRSWRSRYQAWEHFAETAQDVRSQIGFRAKFIIHERRIEQ